LNTQPKADERAEDPVALCILDMVAAGKSYSPQEVAQAFYRNHFKPGMPSDGWRRYLTAVRQQAISLARRGLIEITRKGEVVDPEKFKGVIRLRRPVAGE